jgi:hypothetical protein
MRIFVIVMMLFCMALLFSLVKGQNAAAGSFNFNGNWRYSDTKNGEDNFGQFYNAAYSGGASLTDTIDISGYLRYTKTIVEDLSRDWISPGLTLNNKNDIYDFSIYGNYALQKDSNDNQSESWYWSSSLSSSWINPLLPTLAVSYGQRGSTSNSNKGPREDNSSGRTAWQYWNWLKIFYSIDWSRINTPGVDAVGQDRVTQQAGLLSNQLFFDNRLSLNFGLNYSNSKDTLSGQPGEGGFIPLPLLVTEALYEETNELLTGVLTNDASFLLTDEDPPLTLVINPANDPMNLGFRVDFQRVDLIYLTTLNNIEDFAANFSWYLYSSDNGIDWELEQVSLPFDYDVFEQRFEFEIDSLQVRWLKLVADTSSLLPLQDTEIVVLEVFRKIFSENGGPTVDEQINRDTYNARFNLSYNLKENMLFSYSFSYNDEEGSLDPGRTTLLNATGLTWTPGRYFSGRISASDNTETRQEGLNTNTRQYNLSMSSAPLDTFDFSAGAVVLERYEESELLQHLVNYSFASTARLYTDLYGTLDFNYTQGLSGSTNDNFSERLLLTARLRPTLILNLDQRFSREIEASLDEHVIAPNLNWRISDVLSLSDNLTVAWGDEADTIIRNRIALQIAPNRKNRINFDYGFVDAEVVRHIYAGSWNWLINPLIRFNLRADYLIREEEEDEWGFSATLQYSYNFASDN